VEILDKFFHGNFYKLFTICLSAAHLVITFRSQELRMFKSKEEGSFSPFAT
jgi:hypothetical protein